VASGRRIGGALVAVIGLGLVGLGVASGGKGGGGAASVLDRVAGEIDRKVGETRAAVGARSQTLAQLPRLGPAVATDAATVANLTPTELAFTLGPNEMVELGQRAKAGGVVSSLLRLPASAGTTPYLDRPGSHTGVIGDQLVVTVVSEVTPSERQDEIVGALAVSWSVDVAAQLTALRSAGIRARLDTDGGSLPLGDDPGSAGTTTRPLGVGDARLVAALPAGSGGGGLGVLLWPGLGLALLGLLAALVPGRRPATAGSAGLAPAPAHPATITPPPASTMTPAPGGSDGRPTGALDAARRSLSHDAALAVGPTDFPGVPMPAQPGGVGTTAQGGAMLGRYQLLRRLGAGGMAEVFLAKVHGEAGFSKRVAVKVMHSHLAGRQAALDHFLDEARLASQLAHPNIAQIIDLGRVEDDYFIAMEYIEGCDLERVLAGLRARGLQVPLDIGLAILRRVCDGLDFAHRAVDAGGTPLGLVHRDVKAANVLVSRQGQVKIVDFGIAKAATQVHVTQIGETKGTPSVMAPEQRMGQLVDARADVYSVAALAYELLCGVEVNLDVIFATQRGIDGWPHLPPPSTVRADLPPALDPVLLQALAWEPAARPTSCAVLEESLDAIARGQGLAASDKDLARWLDAVMPADAGAGATSVAG
jgi:tRNA A-37 threonylcarbamoyl transferase component Bud32